MKRFSLAFLAVLLLSAPGLGQTPSGDSAANTIQPSQPTRTTIENNVALISVPDGTRIEIEAPYTFSSMDFKPNDKISFRVVDAVKVDGATLIEQGAAATGRIVKAKRGGHWGKAGLLVWAMESVTAIDGTQIPIRPTSVRLRGDSKGAKVATAMIITGAVMPLIAPVALLHGFKRGENAYIPAGKRYTVFVDKSGQQTANAAQSK